MMAGIVAQGYMGQMANDRAPSAEEAGRDGISGNQVETRDLQNVAFASDK